MLQDRVPEAAADVPTLAESFGVDAIAIQDNETGERYVWRNQKPTSSGESS